MIFSLLPSTDASNFWGPENTVIFRRYQKRCGSQNLVGGLSPESNTDQEPLVEVGQNNSNAELLRGFSEVSTYCHKLT